MTRRTLRRHLRKFVLIVLFIITLAGAAKFAPHLGFNQAWIKEIYQFINEMSLLIFTIGAAYLANIFQQRSNFISSLKEEWHEIVRAKSSLIGYIDNPERTLQQYLQAYQNLSQCIDYMRIVYRNVGETERLIGKYPYEPLHDMRRWIEQIDPRAGGYTIEQLIAVRQAIWDSFDALRERFLEELDLEEPEKPIIGPRAKRTKAPGAKGFEQL